MASFPLLNLNLEALLGVLQFVNVKELVRLKRTSRSLYSIISDNSTALRHLPATLYVKIHNDSLSGEEEPDASLRLGHVNNHNVQPHIGVEIRRGKVGSEEDGRVFFTETGSGMKLRVIRLPPAPWEPSVRLNERNRSGSIGSRMVSIRTFTEWEVCNTRRYRVEAPTEGLSHTELLRAVLKTFTKHLSFDELTVWGAKDANWSEATLEILAQLSVGFERYLKNASIQYGKQKAPEENLMMDFIKNAEIDHFKIYEHLPFHISDNSFKNPTVKKMSFFVFEGESTNITDESFGDLEVSRLSLCKSKNVTVAGIRKWLQPVLDLKKEDKHVTIDLTWEESDWNKVVDGLVYREGEEGQTWVISTADPRKEVKLNFRKQGEEYQFWAKIEKVKNRK